MCKAMKQMWRIGASTPSGMYCCAVSGRHRHPPSSHKVRTDRCVQPSDDIEAPSTIYRHVSTSKATKFPLLSQQKSAPNMGVQQPPQRYQDPATFTPDPPPLMLSPDASASPASASAAVDPDSFDLAARGSSPPTAGRPQPHLEPLERRSLLLFSRTHMRLVAGDAKLLRRFSVFLREQRPAHLPLLVYYLDMMKALAAVRYGSAVVGAAGRAPVAMALGLAPGCPAGAAVAAVREALVARAEAAFRVLADEDLPAWVTSTWMRVVEVSIRRRINGSLPAPLREYVFSFFSCVRCWT